MAAESVVPASDPPFRLRVMSIDLPQAPEAAPAKRPRAESVDRTRDRQLDTLHAKRPDRVPVGPPRRRRAWLLLLLVATVVAGGGVWAYFRAADKGKKDTSLTYEVRRGDLIVTVTEQGVLESANNTEIKCKVRGWSNVTWVVQAGTEVKEGDELVRLDTKQIDDAISLQTTNMHTSRATLERTKSNVKAAEIAIDAYLKGRYQSQLKALEKDLTIAKSNLESAKKMLANTEAMFKRGYVSDLEVKGNRFTLTQAQLELNVRQTAIDVLKRYTKEMELETLRGNLAAARSKLLADEAGLKMDTGRLKRAETELGQCIVRAPKDGLVIHPSAAAWRETPDITEGANVRKDQVLLLMPDLSQMQVKVGVHETIVDRVQPGQVARITLPESDLVGSVSKVASVAQPSGWWSGNVVKYDTVVTLPETSGLKPGMSAEVEIILAEHRDVLTVPVSSVIETQDGRFCWVATDTQPVRRPVQVGDSNDVFIIIEAGLNVGEEVVLNPMDVIDPAELDAMKTIEQNDAEAVEEAT